MKTEPGIFKIPEHMQFQARMKQRLMASSYALLLFIYAAINSVVFGAVALLEWEIVMRVFEFLLDGSEYWSPRLMGMTSFVMIIGFHLLAYKHQKNFAVQFVDTAVQFLLPIYMLGLGLLIAVMLVGDDLLYLINPQAALTIGEVVEAGPSGWLETIFNNLTSPLAVATFSLGLGGLAILNIFVAHELLQRIIKNIGKGTGLISKARSAVKDYRTIRECEERYAQLANEYDELSIYDDNYIKLYLTGEVKGNIAKALMPHKQWLIEHEISDESRFTVQSENVDPKKLQAQIRKIEAISEKDIIGALTPQRKMDDKS